MVADLPPNESPDAYVLGHRERELARLARQGELFADLTRDLLVRAGLRPGMRVLDIGCGVGDVSLIAADIVGPSGSIRAIDPAAAALEMAHARLQAAGKSWVEFAQSDLESCGDLSGFDAVIGRFLLIHFADPGAALAGLASRLRPGARIAFIEFDLNSARAEPPLPLLATCIGWIIEVYRRSGRQPDMGTALYSAFRSASLAPEMIGLTRMSNGADEPGFEFVVESVRSLIPAMGALGIASEAAIDIDTLHQRLMAEAGEGDHCILYPRLVGGWAFVPAR
jgi:ubiquinone/menaquinone biosynthesis C-methylase UbiE